MNLIVNWSLTGNALSAIVFYGISKKNCKKVKNRSICLNLITSTQFLLEKALDCLEVFQELIIYIERRVSYSRMALWKRVA